MFLLLPHSVPTDRWAGHLVSQCKTHICEVTMWHNARYCNKNAQFSSPHVNKQSHFFNLPVADPLKTANIIKLSGFLIRNRTHIRAPFYILCTSTLLPFTLLPLSLNPIISINNKKSKNFTECQWLTDKG